jgi:hypothetical protein
MDKYFKFTKSRYLKNKQKSVTPGYNTPGCEAWKYEEISCRAAEAMYKQVLELRYGISNCCPEEDKQYIVQKELIDLAALYDPAYPCSTNSCGCNNNCNCSTAEPVCPPLPPLPITSYNCTDGACVLVSGPGGQYPTLAACEENCTPLPIISYNCVPLHSGSYCLDPGDGTGLYNTLIECENDCLTTYNCVNGNCVPISGPNGEYPTLVDCENSFIIVNQCIDQGIIYSPIFGTLENQFDWMSINHPSSLTYSYYFEANIQCGPLNCGGPNGGCLQRLSSIEIVDIANMIVLFVAYQIDDLINYLNTNYPTCTPVFFDGQSFNTIASQFKICNPSLSIQLGGTPCVCSLGCADIE